MASVLEAWWVGQYPCYSIQNLQAIPIYHTLLTCEQAFSADKKGYNENFKLENDCRIYEWVNPSLGYGEKIGHDLSSDTWFYEHWFPESICRTVVNSWKNKDSEWGFIIRYYNAHELWQKWSVKNNERHFEEFEVHNEAKKGEILHQKFRQGGLEEYIEKYLETSYLNKKEKEWIMPGYHKLETEFIQQDIYSFTQTLTTEHTYEKKVIKKAQGKELRVFEGQRGQKSWKEVSECDNDRKVVDNSYSEEGRKWGNRLKTQGNIQIKEEWEGQPNIEESTIDFKALEKLLNLIISDNWEYFTENWTNLALERVSKTIEEILIKYGRELKLAASYFKKDLEEMIVNLKEEDIEYISTFKNISSDLQEILYKDIITLFDIIQHSFKLNSLKQDIHLLRIQYKQLSRSSLDSHIKPLSIFSSDHFDTLTTCSEDYKKSHNDDEDIIRLRNCLGPLIALSMQNYNKLMSLVGDICDTSASHYSSFSNELDLSVNSDIDRAFEFEKKKAGLLEKFEEMKDCLYEVVRELRDQRLKRDVILIGKNSEYLQIHQNVDSNFIDALLEEFNLCKNQGRFIDSVLANAKGFMEDLLKIDTNVDKELQTIMKEINGISDLEYKQKVSELNTVLEAGRDLQVADSIVAKIELMSLAMLLLSAYKQKLIENTKSESAKKDVHYSMKIFQLVKSSSNQEKLIKNHDAERMDYKNFISSMNDLVKSTQLEMTQVRSEFEILSQRNQSLQQQIESCQDIIDQSDEYIRTLLIDLRNQEEQAVSLQTFITQKLKDKLDPNELRKLDNSRSMRQEIVLLKHRNIDKNQQIINNNKQLLETIRNIEELKLKLLSAQAEVEIYQERLRHLESQFEEARENLVKINEAESIGSNVIKQNLKRIKTKISNYKTMYHVFKEENARIENQYSDLQVQAKDYRTKFQTLQLQNKTLINAAEELKRVTSEAQEWRFKHDELKRVLETYESLGERGLEQALHKLNSEITTKQRELEAVHSSFKSSKQNKLRERELLNFMAIRKSLSYLANRIREMKRLSFQKWSILSKVYKSEVFKESQFLITLKNNI